VLFLGTMSVLSRWLLGRGSVSAATLREQEDSAVPSPADDSGLDDFARRELEVVTRMADALGIPDLSVPPGEFAEGSQPAAPLARVRASSPARALALVRSLDPNPPRPAFVDAVTTPFRRLADLPGPDIPKGGLAYDDSDPTEKVIIDEELLYGDPEISVSTAPLARITWRRPDEPA
jgi:hypothetical protein